VIEFRLSRPGDYEAIAGEEPPYTVRAMTVTVDGEPTAIYGFYEADGFRFLFSEIRSDWERDSAVLRRAYRHGRGMLLGCTGPIFAIRNTDEPTAARVLEHLGFQAIGEQSSGIPFYVRMPK
jgi:hypothetical protein